METLDSSRGFFVAASVCARRRFGGGGGGCVGCWPVDGGGAMLLGGGGGGFFRLDGGGGGGLGLGGRGLLPAAVGGGAGRVIVCEIAIVVLWSPIGAFGGAMIFTTFVIGELIEMSSVELQSNKVNCRPSAKPCVVDSRRSSRSNDPPLQDYSLSYLQGDRQRGESKCCNERKKQNLAPAHRVPFVRRFLREFRDPRRPPNPGCPPSGHSSHSVSHRINSCSRTL